MSDPLTLARSCDQLAAALRALDAYRAECKADLAKLIELGTVRASEHWRDGKYLYLIHPTDSAGQRKREYIGADPDRIANARAALARQRAADELAATLKTITEKTTDAWRWCGHAKHIIDAVLVTSRSVQELANVTSARTPMVTPGARSSRSDVTNQRDLW